jgi:hypothetical protein
MTVHPGRGDPGYMHEQTGPRRYRIVVRGRVGEHLAASFGGFELAFEAGETTLTGSLRDQAQLHGMLERLGDLGIQLVSINGVEPRR